MTFTEKHVNKQYKLIPVFELQSGSNLTILSQHSAPDTITKACGCYLTFLGLCFFIFEMRTLALMEKWAKNINKQFTKM